jgi:capsule biosynthesis phosphatase
MKYILLCGGMGKRTNQYSLPKPLNYIYGRHMIEYLIENIPSQDIYIIYNIFLDEYQFQTILRNKCKTKTLHFSAVEYMTRGAVETAYVGTQQFPQLLSSTENENLVFIDNDNLHTFPVEIPVFCHDFIGYSIDYHKTNYSFICTDAETGRISDIAEKQKISDHYCCGFYGFKNLPHFLSLAKELLDANEKTKNEFYFSQLYKHALDKGEVVEAFYIEHTQHLGTYEEILSQSLFISDSNAVSKAEIQKKKLRFCFDLDNTLVSYPVIPGDYSTVQPIAKMIQTIRQLKQDGHEIVIYTARRMATHHHSIGKVVRDIGMITMKTLEDLNIPYDELIFGKPIADIYVDDRAINPYSQSLSYFGFFMQEEDFLPNKVKNNKYNHIERRQQTILKTGPERFIRGELFYYQHIPLFLTHYFPKFLGFSEIRETSIGEKGEERQEYKIQLQMEYIQGIPLYYLYKNQLLTTMHMEQLWDILDKFHTTITSNGETVNREDILSNYYNKLASRFLEHPEDYPFENAMEVYTSLIERLQKYDYAMENVAMIHGDFWFSNLLLTYEDQMKCIDMKGQVNGKLTLGGDRYYDYGKMYQSILGYDLILNGIPITPQWKEYQQKIEEHFWKHIEYREMNAEYVISVTKSLLFGVFHSLNETSQEIKQQIWKLVEEI